MRKRVHKRVQVEVNTHDAFAFRIPSASDAARSGKSGLGVTEPQAFDEVAEVTDVSQLPADRTRSDLTDERPLETMIATTSDAIIAISQQFSILDLNPAAASSLGWSHEEAVGRLCKDVLRCQNLNRMVLCGTSSCPLASAFQGQTALPNEELIIGALGTPQHQGREYSLCVTPLTPTHGPPYAVFTARDMSTLKVVNSVRSNFISMVSHELRTPLNSVHGFIDLILQGHMGPLTEDQQIYLGYTQEGVQQLISIVEDILFMTRSDLGQFLIKPQQVQLSTLVKQVLLSMQPQALKGTVVISHDIPADVPLLHVDPIRIKQVLNNLVANAIKFTPPGGKVTISTRRHDERFQLISVTDTGYGIMPEDRPHVFERFYQSNHSMQSRMGGYGLGLSIAQLIVEQHGGVIGFDTEVNKGTTFYFTVPIVVEQEE